MAKAQKNLRTSSFSQRKIRKLYSNHPAGVVFAGFALIIVFGYSGWRAVATYAQYRRFQQVDKSISELESRFRLSFDNSVTITSRKSCDRAGSEFGGGRLSCTRGLSVGFLNTEVSSSSTSIISSEDIILNQLTPIDKGGFNLATSLKENIDLDVEFIEKDSGVHCYLSTRNIKNLIINVGCTELSLWKYFPDSK